MYLAIIGVVAFGVVGALLWFREFGDATRPNMLPHTRCSNHPSLSRLLQARS
jgi:hypothetical protein